MKNERCTSYVRPVQTAVQRGEDSFVRSKHTQRERGRKRRGGREGGKGMEVEKGGGGRGGDERGRHSTHVLLRDLIHIKDAEVFPAQERIAVPSHHRTQCQQPLRA